MKKFLFAIALVSGMSLTMAAQQAAAGASQGATASAGQSQVDQSAAASAQTAHNAASARSSEAAYDYMRPVDCELAGKLDSKTAKAGDAVIAKTRQNLRAADGSVIPKGAKLVGHVADVQAHTSSEADSHLSIVFDRVEWSGGHSVPVHSVIQAVTPPVNAFASGSADGDALGGPIGGAGSRGGGGARGSGGLLGGTAGAAGSATGNVGTGLGANAGGALRTAGQTTGDLAGNAAAVSSIGVSPAASASMGAHATGVAGVMLAGDASGATAGTLSASKRNVHLDAGTQLTVAISATPSQ